MTVIRPNSISGITSLTAHRGSIDFYAHDGSAATFNNINSNVTSGVSTFASLNITGDLDVGGALTYEDVTNIDSVGVITARNAIVISEDNAIHFRGTAADDADAILRASAGGGQLLINSRNDTIINIDSNNDSTDAHFAIGHGAATGSSTELFKVQESGDVTQNSGTFTVKAASGDSSGLKLSQESGDESRIFNHFSGPLTFGTGNTERLRITSDGKVAIGFNAPAVAGLSLANSSTSLGFEFDTASGFAGGPTIRGYHRPSTAYKSLGITGADIKFGINDVEKLRLDSNGYLGLNNAAPHNQYYNNLVIGDGSASGDKGITIRTQSSNEGVIAFSDADSGAARYAGKIAYSHSTNAMMFFTLNGDERLRIASDGKVGINETNPSYRLHIKETTSSSNYALIENTTSGNAGVRLKNSQGDYVVFVGPDFRVYDWTNSVDRLRIDSSGRILKGISSSILGNSDVQLAGSGGPAKIAGYKSDNNPTANTSMLTVTGYSQSGSTFTGVGEIDFRVDQNSNTASGYHPGTIVTRVNGGSTTGTHAGTAYSYAGLKDRERITFKSKRYYSLPEWASGSDTYNNFREEWDYQHYVGYNRYSWYRFTSHSSSSSRGGSVDIRVTWSTRHAAGNGYGHWAFHWRDNHGTGYMDIGNVYKYHSSYLSGSYYGWSSNPNIHVYEINDSGNNAGFYLRVQGHIDANSSTYDGGVMHQFLISAHTNRYGADVNKFEFVGNSTPSDVGSQQTNINIP